MIEFILGFVSGVVVYRYFPEIVNYVKGKFTKDG